MLCSPKWLKILLLAVFFIATVFVPLLTVEPAAEQSSIQSSVDKASPRPVLGVIVSQIIGLDAQPFRKNLETFRELLCIGSAGYEFQESYLSNTGSIYRRNYLLPVTKIWLVLGIMLS